jgi:hypothetical protein
MLRMRRPQRRLGGATLPKVLPKPLLRLVGSRVSQALDEGRTGFCNLPREESSGRRQARTYARNLPYPGPRVFQRLMNASLVSWVHLKGQWRVFRLVSYQAQTRCNARILTHKLTHSERLLQSLSATWQPQLRI